MQVEFFLERSAANDPRKTALVCSGRAFTYQEIDAGANRLAHSLVDQSLERGDRVALYLENSVEAVLGIFAVLKAGCVFVVVNPKTKVDKLSYILNHARVKGLITDARRFKSLQHLCGGWTHLQSIWVAGCSTPPEVSGAGQILAIESVLNGVDKALSPEKRSIDLDLAALIFTSGSMGRPKGVMLTHLNMVSAANSITEYLENRPTDVILNALPLSFDYGLYQLLMAFKVGGTLVLERSFAFPQRILEKIASVGVTGFPIVPAVAAILLRLDVSKYSFPALRYVTSTAAALSSEHIRGLRRAFPQAKIYSMYGLTECKRVSYLPPDQIDYRPGSVGKAMPNEEVYIVDGNGDRVAPGVVGELVVRGSNVMSGYWEEPQETEQRLRPGPLPWEKVLYTGDLFRMDEEGYLYFIGRKDDIIKTGGEKVSPREVEDVLYGLDGVFEAAVIGVDDPIMGQVIKAVIAVSSGSALSSQDVLRHCARHLESFKVPHVVEFRPALPKTANGKIDRMEIAGT